MSRGLPLAGFQVTFIGRFWVITEALCFAVAGEAFVLTSPFIERDYRKVGIFHCLLLRDQLFRSYLISVQCKT